MCLLGRRIVFHMVHIFVTVSYFITGVPLRCYHFETTSAIARILRQRHFFEQHPDLEPKGTVALDPTIRHFLWRKGFKSDGSITELEKITGSLNLSCVILLHVLPRRPAKVKVGGG